MLSLRWFLLALLTALHAASRPTVPVASINVAFYINEDHMPARREAMESQLTSADLHAQRWSAINWEKVAHGDFDKDYVKRQGMSTELQTMVGQDIGVDDIKRRFGTVGAFLSHVTALVEASKKLQPNDIALIMEDDVSIPKDWKIQLKSVIDNAPNDWDMLKLSGFGSHRAADLHDSSEVSSAQEEQLPSSSGSVADTFKNILKAVLLADYFMKFFGDYTRPMYWMLHGPFKEPSIIPLVGPTIFYGGLGAYVVRGSSIHTVINHLRSQPIDDVDALMLRDGMTHSYDVLPHIFELADIHSYGPGLHTWTSDLDERDVAAKKKKRGMDHIFMGPTSAWEFIEDLPHSASSSRTVLYAGGLIVTLIAMTLLMTYQSAHPRRAHELNGPAVCESTPLCS